MRYLFIILLFISLFLPVYAKNLYTVDNPTAAQLDKGEARVDLKSFKNNGIFIGADVGLFESFQFGVAYGAENIVGDQKPEWLNKVEFRGRFRLINETVMTPAVSIGVDTQGHGHYLKDKKRYEMMSKGVYAVGSKNFQFLGLLGFDLGCNYTFEKTNLPNRQFDIFAGVYKTIGDQVTVFADWSAGLNDYNSNVPTEKWDDLKEVIGKGRTYLNTGVEVSLSEHFALKLLMYDMFRNRDKAELFDRALLLDYHWYF